MRVGEYFFFIEKCDLYKWENDRIHQAPSTTLKYPVYRYPSVVAREKHKSTHTFPIE